MTKILISEKILEKDLARETNLEIDLTPAVSPDLGIDHVIDNIMINLDKEIDTPGQESDLGTGIDLGQLDPPHLSPEATQEIDTDLDQERDNLVIDTDLDQERDNLTIGTDHSPEGDTLVIPAHLLEIGEVIGIPQEIDRKDLTLGRDIHRGEQELLTEVLLVLPVENLVILPRIAQNQGHLTKVLLVIIAADTVTMLLIVQIHDTMSTKTE